MRLDKSKDERHEPWLLIKENDEEARPASEFDVVAELPESVLTKPTKKSAKGNNVPHGAVPAKLPLSLAPQLATLVEEPPRGKGWIYEVKFDGYRILARIDGDDIRLFTRNGNDWTPRMKSLRDEVAALGIASGWVDGEIVVPDAKGNPDFQALQNAFDSSATEAIVFFAFDLPYFGGYDLRRAPCIERRALLEKLFESNQSARLIFSSHFEGEAAQLLEGTCRKGLEGLIGKRADAPYVSKRSSTWIKLKCTRRQEFVIGGYTDPKASRVGFGSLLLGTHDADGKLRYAGNVGTGFDRKLLRSLKEKLAALETDAPPFADKPRDVKGHWVKPKLVAEIAFTEWTGDGRVRHPVFHGLRTDKDPRAVTGEAALQEAPREMPAKKPRTTKSTKSTKRSESGNTVAGVKVSNPDRVVDPSTGTTKLDLVRYYERIAPHMLPHLEGRPVALVRAPSGIGGELFFQKHGDTIRIPGIKVLDPSLWPGHAAMLEISTRTALVGAAQMNVIELHTWNSTTRAIDKPDRVIFDLDPGKGVSWRMLLEATSLTKQMLDILGLESFLKTSGGTGLHVVVPLTPRLGYDEVKDFSRAVVTHLAATLPKVFVAKSGERNRVGRIFVDYLRNGRGATTVAAFSARARAGLGVSTPLKWAELESLKSADEWNIVIIHDRLARLRQDPWKDYKTTKQSLTAAMKRIGK